MITWPAVLPEVREFAGVTRRLAGEVVGPRRQEIHDSDEIPIDIIDALVTSGLWGIALPEVTGGSAAGPVVAAIVAAELAAVSPGVALVTAASSLLGATSWSEADLTTIAQGGRVAVIDSLSPLVSIRSQGSGITELEGARIDDGASSDLAVLLVPTTPMIVAADEWRTRSRPAMLDRAGLRGFPPCSLTWRGRALSGATETTIRLRAWWLLLLAAVATGIVTAGAALAREHASERKQFGRAIIEFGAVRHVVGSLDTAAADLAQALITAAGDLDEDEPSAPTSALRLARRSTRDAVAFCGDVIQVHGGYGYMAESQPARLFREAVSLRAVCAGSCLPSA